MKRSLFVIDYQNDFVDGALGFRGAELLDEGIADKVLSYGKGNVFYTLDTHDEGYLSSREGRSLPVKHCVKGGHGWRIYGKTADALEKVSAVCIEKHSFGMDVSSSRVQKVLPDAVDEIELVGLVSNICVLSNAVVLQARYPQANIIVDAALTGSFDESLNEKALDVLCGLQVEVTNRS